MESPVHSSKDMALMCTGMPITTAALDQAHNTTSFHLATRIIGVICTPSLVIYCFVGNILILAALLTERKLRHISSVLIGCLILPDLAMVFTVSPILFWTYLTNEWSFSLEVYKLYMYVACASFVSSVAHQCAIAIQKYTFIVHGAKVLMMRRSIALSVFISWILAVALLAPTFCSDLKGSISVTHGADNIFYPNLSNLQMWLYTGYTILSCLLMAYCYGRIFHENRKVGSRVIWFQRGRVSSVLIQRAFHVRQVALARTTAAYTLIMFLTYSPFALLRALDVDMRAHRALYTAFTLTYLLGTASNAVLYGLLHETFREAYKRTVCRLVCWLKQTSDNVGSHRQMALSSSSSVSSRVAGPSNN